MKHLEKLDNPTSSGLRVIALSGLPGSGKTRLANALAPALGAYILSRDVLRVLFFSALPNEQGKQFAFEMMKNIIRRHEGYDAVWVIDGMPLGSEEQQADLSAIVASVGGVLDWVWLDVSIQVAKDRVAAQTGHPSSDRGPDLVDTVAARFTPPKGAKRIDATGVFKDTYSQALSAI